MMSKVFSRELGPQEALFLELTKQSKGGLQLISFIKICEPVTVELLLDGFAYLHQRHPILRARVKRGERLRWVCDVDFKNIPLQLHKLTQPMDFEDEYCRHGMKCLDSEECVYGLTLYTNKNGLVDWIVIVNVHAVLDGRSIMTLCLDLDGFLRSEGKISDVQSLPLRASIASSLDAAGYLGEKEFIHQSKDVFNWPVEKAVFASERRACATSLLMPPETAKLLSQVGKKGKVKLTAIYCAIAALASRVLPVYQDFTEIILTLDGRVLCVPPISLDNVGSFSQTTSLEIPPEFISTGFLSLASYIQSQIDMVLAKRRPMTKNLGENYKAKYIEKMASETVKKQSYFPAGICVSNVGNMRRLAGEMRYFEIEKGMVTQTNGLNPLTVITYTTYRNAVFVFGYCEPLLSKKSVSLYVDKYVEIIRGLICKG
ncbi:hypothetical protein MO867_06875 [Microbulbifer sp. OS29]|uniref:Condensation domain-containing protein n=1 Tax=Microbulbifer okhotskensis TaxID=2926617 RepID=A0A9X2J4G1_9GAMM|nr:hypothetical protein [Microbulbifer okhotskensis]MCO1334063.1 hypothetical protein [Microbulbifer okhotskensis]